MVLNRSHHAQGLPVFTPISCLIEGPEHRISGKRIDCGGESTRGSGLSCGSAVRSSCSGGSYGAVNLLIVWIDFFNVPDVLLLLLWSEEREHVDTEFVASVVFVVCVDFFQAVPIQFLSDLLGIGRRYRDLKLLEVVLKLLLVELDVLGVTLSVSRGLVLEAVLILIDYDLQDNCQQNYLHYYYYQII